MIAVGVLLVLATQALGNAVDASGDTAIDAPSASTEDPVVTSSNEVDPLASSYEESEAASGGSNRHTRVLFIYGLDASGAPSKDCSANFGEMRARLRDWGWTGAFYNVGYYYADRGSCRWRIDHHGGHSKDNGGGSDWQDRENHQRCVVNDPGHGYWWCNDIGHSQWSHNADTNIRHLGFHFAWFVWQHFSRPNPTEAPHDDNGVVVDIVAHSMGGLIARYALAQVQRDNDDYPPYLRVGDVVTYGTPHKGAQSFTHELCTINVTQCKQMEPGSDFLQWLAGNAENPQVRNGTQWTTIGSECDGHVSEQSAATGMNSRYRVNYWEPCYGHSGYLEDGNGAYNANVTHWKRGWEHWRRWQSAPHSMRWGDAALATTDW